MDGDENVDAVAKYIAGDEIEYAVCKKHLEDVKKSHLVFWLLDKE